MTVTILHAVVVGCLGLATTGAARADEAAGAAPLWHRRFSAAGMRIVGEAGTLTLPVYVPARAAAAVRRFQIGYHAAVQVNVAARYGGEEFAVLLPDIDKAGAFHVAERCRRAVRGATSP